MSDSVGNLFGHLGGYLILALWISVIAIVLTLPFVNKCDDDDDNPPGFGY